MRLTFALSIAVLVGCTMLGEMAPSLGRESPDRDQTIFSVDDPLDGESLPEGNGESEEGGSPEMDLGALEALEARPTTGKRSEIDRGSAWVRGRSANRRAFSPWGGKRYFNPWGGKRIRGIYLERKANSVFDKRPGFQPWGGKRAAAPTPELESGSDASVEKRAFSPWGGKRQPAASRDQIEDLIFRQGLKEKRRIHQQA